MQQCLCFAHVQIPHLMPFQNHPGIQNQTSDVVGIFWIQLEAIFSRFAAIPADEGLIIKEFPHLGVAEPDLQSAEHFCIQIIVGSVKVHSCQIVCQLLCHLREHFRFVQLETADFQIGNIFHSKNQICIIVEVKLRNILRNDDPADLHVIVFDSSPFQTHTGVSGNTANGSGLLEDHLPFSVADTKNIIDVAVAVVFCRTFTDF